MTRPLFTVLGRLRDLMEGRSAGDPTDAELLDRFSHDRDEAAFAALVRRHGPMVLGVCRRILGDDHDADDAFQAAFLVLARQAANVRRRASVGAWLHGVALRVAWKAKVTAARRRAHERRAEVVTPTDPLAAVEWRDLRPILDEELDHLDEKYRAPLVLCYLEGKSHEEAARLLHCPNGTVCGRLARGRDLLRRRLAKRGLACAPVALAALLADHTRAAVPAELAVAAVRGVVGPTASAAIVGLADGIAPAGFGARLKLTAIVMALGTLSTSAGLFLMPAPRPGPQVPKESKSDAGLVLGTDGRPGVTRWHVGAPVLAVAIGPGGLVATAGGGSMVRLWRADSAQAIADLPGHEGGAAAVAFSPDGHTLATADYAGIVRLWSVPAGTLRRSLSAHTGAAVALAFAPDGHTFASVGWDGWVRLWDSVTGQRRGDWAAHRGRAWAVAFSPDGRRLATAGGDQSVTIWDTAGQELRRFRGLKGGAYAVAFAPDGRSLLVSADNTVQVRDADSGAEIARVGGPQTEVAWFALAPDGHTLAWGGADRRVHLWEVAARAERLQLDGHAQPVSCLAFAPGGRSLVSAGPDGTAVIWDLARLLRPANLSADQLAAAGTDLASDDARRAYRAIWALAAAPDQAGPLLRDRLNAQPDFARHLDQLIANLDSPAAAERDLASARLEALGPEAEAALRRALPHATSAESQRRIERLLAALANAPRPDAPTVAQARAVEALELIGTPAARAVLETLADRKPETPLARTARAARDRLRP